MFGRQILILAPHPDDEVVGCAAAIGRARARGARVHVTYLTTGVPAPDVLWPWQRHRHGNLVGRRRAEAIAAAKQLAIEPLEFREIPTRALRLHLADTRRAIMALVDRHQIDVLWVPAYEGGHQDHDAANFIASRIESGAEVWEFAEYNFAGGTVRCQTFIDPAGDEISLDLTPDEAARKRSALSLYASEKGNLGHVGTGRECFRPLAGYDYAGPPHPGRTFYQRFQWVPFRHPRIDFTTPEDLCRVLAADATH
ncbi:MAG: PIG-L family deacetylase [Alphaproteobacteria bacterium]|nr:PIG-L family deacetylase [Alphaproteobacteria bacterium]